MSENRLPDYLDHIQQAATDARSFKWDRTTTTKAISHTGYATKGALTELLD